MVSVEEARKHVRQVAVQDYLVKEKLRHATERKRWGIDNTNIDEYWNDPRIHSLGNVGLGGVVHALLAPFSTKLIDVLAYDGADVRHLVSIFWYKLRLD